SHPAVPHLTRPSRCPRWTPEHMRLRGTARHRSLLRVFGTLEASLVVSCWITQLFLGVPNAAASSPSTTFLPSSKVKAKTRMPFAPPEPAAFGGCPSPFTFYPS